MSDIQAEVTRNDAGVNSIDLKDAISIHHSRDRIPGHNKLYSLLVLVSSALWVSHC